MKTIIAGCAAAFLLLELALALEPGRLAAHVQADARSQLAAHILADNMDSFR